MAGRLAQEELIRLSVVDTREARLLTVLQKEFPISAMPYDDVARALDRDPDEVVREVQDLVDRRIIRRIGAVVNTKGLGFSSTLAAIKVPPHRLGEAAAIVSQYRGVTHNYARAHVVNLWFTMIAESSELLELCLTEIEDRTGLDVLRMPTLKLFKLGLKLDMNRKKHTLNTGRGSDTSVNHNRAVDLSDEVSPVFDAPRDLPPLETVRSAEMTIRIQKAIQDSPPYQKTSVDDRRLLRELQGNLPVTRHPFGRVAEQLDVTEQDIVEHIRQYVDQKWVRRLGVILYHQRAGFTHNAMVGWIVPTNEVDEVGGTLAGFESVSHCYERPTYPPDWPYNVFTMIHARSDDELSSILGEMIDTIGDYKHRALLSIHEFKKTSMEYF